MRLAKGDYLPFNDDEGEFSNRNCCLEFGHGKSRKCNQGYFSEVIATIHFSNEPRVKFWLYPIDRPHEIIIRSKPPI
jgi:hypothetical protein